MAVPLVIIDMQKEFSYSRVPALIDKTVKHIKRAIERNAPIIVVEFRGFGKTQTAITKTLAGYRYITVFKDTRDGSKEVQTALMQENGLFCDICRKKNANAPPCKRCGHDPSKRKGCLVCGSSGKMIPNV